jgi:hypothetical protein
MIDFDDPEAAAADVLARAELIKRAYVMAGANPAHRPAP